MIVYTFQTLHLVPGSVQATERVGTAGSTVVDGKFLHLGGEWGAGGRAGENSQAQAAKLVGKM